MHPKLKKIAVNSALVTVSAAVALCLCEMGTRLFLNPADYLSKVMVKDKVLGAVLAPQSSGYDKWGFRNHTVPQSVDVVAIGDSHTFGNCAKMDESWPAVVSRLSGKSVYSLAMGGYGPNQYFHLFETKALLLKPRAIVCGLYMGDDFENAFLITYGLDHWAYLRDLPANKVNFDIWQAPAAGTWHKRVRNWFACHSVIYKLIFHGPLVGRFKGEVQIKNAERLYDSATSLVIEEKNIVEAFLPKGIARRLNQDHESVREGMRITFKLLDEMHKRCRNENIEFIVAVIPTKETVFADHLEGRPGLHLGDVIDKLIADERIARNNVFGFLKGANIRYVDTLPALKSSINKELYARTAADMHPNRNGYRVIAEAVAGALTAQAATNQNVAAWSSDNQLAK